MENETKHWWASSSIWGSLVVILASGANMIGYTITLEDQAQIIATAHNGAQLAANLAAFGGAVVAILGRIRATKRIG